MEEKLRELVRQVLTKEFSYGTGDNIPVLMQQALEYYLELIPINRMLDKQLVKTVYLWHLPKEAMGYGHAAGTLQLLITRLYYIMGREGWITHEEALEMVGFFQGMQDEFFDNMEGLVKDEAQRKEKEERAKARANFLPMLGEPDENGLEFDNVFAGLRYYGSLFDAYQLRVALVDTKPAVWRRVVVPVEITMLQLHEVLQVVFGWEDTYDFYFGDSSIDYVHAFGTPPHDGKGFGPWLAGETFIACDYDTEYPPPSLYHYGPDWVVQISIEERIQDLSLKDQAPKVLRGRGAVPTEDYRQLPETPYERQTINRGLQHLWQEYQES